MTSVILEPLGQSSFCLAMLLTRFNGNSELKKNIGKYNRLKWQSWTVSGLNRDLLPLWHTACFQPCSFHTEKTWMEWTLREETGVECRHRYIISFAHSSHTRDLYCLRPQANICRVLLPNFKEKTEPVLKAGEEMGGNTQTKIQLWFLEMLTVASRRVCSLIASSDLRAFNSCWSRSLSSTTTCILFFIPESSSCEKSRNRHQRHEAFLFVDYETIQRDIKHGRLTRIIFIQTTVS